MLDHISIRVGDYRRAQDFYDQALAAVGLTRVMSDGQAFAGYGEAGKPIFWIGLGDPGGGAHVAFSAPDHATVEAFHRAALGAGGRDNGAPGLRAHYHPTYYAAFVLDPDGNNIEAVCHGPAGAAAKPI